MESFVRYFYHQPTPDHIYLYEIRICLQITTFVYHIGTKLNKENIVHEIN